MTSLLSPGRGTAQELSGFDTLYCVKMVWLYSPGGLLAAQADQTLPPARIIDSPSTLPEAHF